LAWPQLEFLSPSPSPEPRLGILKLAGKRGVDLVALGTRGRKGLERFLLGSVADYVLRGAPTDVLAVPPAD